MQHNKFLEKFDYFVENLTNFEECESRFNLLIFVISNTIIYSIFHLIFPLVGVLYGLTIFIPMCAIMFRRLHDAGLSGWIILINLIPIIGNLVFIILLLLPKKLSSKYCDSKD